MSADLIINLGASVLFLAGAVAIGWLLRLLRQNRDAIVGLVEAEAMLSTCFSAHIEYAAAERDALAHSLAAVEVERDGLAAKLKSSIQRDPVTGRLKSAA